MRKWEEYKAQELIDSKFLVIGDGYRAKNIELGSEGIPFARAGNINDGFDFSESDLFPLEHIKRVGEKVSQPGDVVFTSKGTVGRFAFVRKETKQFVYSPQLCFWRSLNGNIIHPKFLFYWMRGRQFFEQIEGLKGQTDMADYVNLADQRNMKISLPEIKVQESIAEILTSLDDKLDLLNRQNETLEQLAETLFRQWFVVDADANILMFLEEFVETTNGVSYKSSELNPSKIAMVSLKSFDRNGGFRIDGFKEFTGKYKAKQVVQEGDLIVAHTDITQEAEVIGNPALVFGNPNYETLVISMDMVKVVPKVDWVSIEFLYYLMRSKEFKGHCEANANGSTVLHLSKQAIPTFQFPIPDKSSVLEFTKQAKELNKKVFFNHNQIRTLTKLRDSLIPKLMSGEVKVS